MAVGLLAIFTCYFSPNVADVLVELDLATLEEYMGKWKSPLILASDFNSKARASIGGPRDPRGDLLEEMRTDYILVVAKQPGMHTFEKRITRSILDLIFASPEVTKKPLSWQVLDTKSLSDHRYILTKLPGKV